LSPFFFKYVTESESSSDEDDDLEDLTAEQNRQLALLQEMEEVLSQKEFF